ncbi:DUF397 domain-containing protein [Kitasatospora sp. NBC_01302]|uniref:DUF397 domain-containing protein n=1 Tax=Kitasatospora sp. NBC_01302 TaxID=2903575 RepID=UPI002E163384|nr:DUF397 domain-containing protein [Kitasatospora sp. NBC_01302]
MINDPATNEMPKVEPAHLTWIKAAASSGSGACVEIAHLPEGGVFLRDSKDKSRPIHWYTAQEWTAFLSGAKNGEFDVPNA